MILRIIAPLVVLGLAGSLWGLYRNNNQKERDLYARGEILTVKNKLVGINLESVDAPTLTSLFKHDFQQDRKGALINAYKKKISFSISGGTDAPRVYLAYPVPQKSCPAFVQFLITNGIGQVKVEGQIMSAATSEDARHRIAKACGMKSASTVAILM